MTDLIQRAITIAKTYSFYHSHQNFLIPCSNQNFTNVHLHMKLLGDPLQLGPTITSRVAAECGLAESYLERLINRFPYARDPVGFPKSGGYDPRLVTKLVHNYRSLPDILAVPDKLFYKSELRATVSGYIIGRIFIKSSIF